MATNIWKNLMKIQKLVRQIFVIFSEYMNFTNKCNIFVE